MDRNTITGLVIIALILIGYSYFMSPSKEELKACMSGTPLHELKPNGRSIGERTPSRFCSTTTKYRNTASRNRGHLQTGFTAGRTVHSGK